MKRFGLVLSLLLVVFCSSLSMAAEKGSGFYVGILGGYLMPQDVNMSKTSGNPMPVSSFTMNKGFLAGIKAGYTPLLFDKYVAAELEYNYARTSFDTSKIYVTNGGSWTVDGTSDMHAFFFNVKLRYPEGWFHPYIGVGPGLAWVKQGDVTTTSDGTRAGATATTFAYQLLAGVDFDITKNWGAGIGYKFYEVKPNFGDNLNLDMDIKAHVVTLGVNYSF